MCFILFLFTILLIVRITITIDITMGGRWCHHGACQWRPRHIGEGQDVKVGAREHQWEPGHVDGGQSASVGSKTHQ